MDYFSIYMKIVTHAKEEAQLGKRPLFKSRKFNGNFNQKFKDKYFEMHHIKPRSLFPELEKDPENIVPLTLREHFFCHQLLTKIYPTSEMFYALWQMANRGEIKSSKQFEKIKEYVFKSGFFKSTLGKKIYNNGIIEKYFFEDEVPDGFIKGKLKSKKIYNNGIIEKYFFEDEVPDGFIYGTLVKRTPVNSGKKCYTNGKINIYLGDNEEIPKGFKKGGCYNRANSGAKKGNKCPTKGLKHFNNGIEEIMAEVCPDGFKAGRLNPKKYATTIGFSWWNNGKEQKLCKEKPDENWIKGRLYYGKNKVNKTN